MQWNYYKSVGLDEHMYFQRKDVVFAMRVPLHVLIMLLPHADNQIGWLSYSTVQCRSNELIERVFTIFSLGEWMRNWQEFTLY